MTFSEALEGMAFLAAMTTVHPHQFLENRLISLKSFFCLFTESLTLISTAFTLTLIGFSFSY